MSSSDDSPRSDASTRTDPIRPAAEPDRAVPVQYLTPSIALVSMGLTWLFVTSDNVSHQALNRLVALAIIIGLLLLARRRWLWALAALIAAASLSLGLGLGGLTGIAWIVVGNGLGAAALVIALDETWQLIIDRRQIDWRRVIRRRTGSRRSESDPTGSRSHTHR